ncbi:DUF4191 domain-containing protein [Arsenicicoccus sp. oral taxon 190]|uniref:DUF4191 domain-containing protein n=1 Tax=Arsenicicoccus sp. oral taxon 190 TaxID=1658671 RepID=UPI00067A04C1|nr:DUF4191 domain-containing protein [Arsenicicoccus sp. oral taxon 190]AKT52104.1 hypothetical protein ADJ73_13930 [Arsenicicoccus sp. oral taxon 190]
MARQTSGSTKVSRFARKPKDPSKPGRFAQIKQGYGFAKQVDPKITQWMVGAAALVLLVMVAIGLITGHPWYFLIIGIPLAALAALLVMSRRTDRGAYAMIEGKPGATMAALSSIRRGGWYIEQQPIAADGRPRGQDYTGVATLYRAVGRPGVVLVAEGPTARAKKLLVEERRKVERLASGAPVITLRVAEGESDDPEQISVRKLASKVQRLKPVLTKEEVTVVNKRLKAMSGLRTGIPAGMDPTRARVDRKGMRGR